MSTKHKDSVRWLFLKDHDGRVFLTSDKGARYTFKNKREAKAAFESLVRHTMDIVENLLDCETSTIKFQLEF